MITVTTGVRVSKENVTIDIDTNNAELLRIVLTKVSESKTKPSAITSSELYVVRQLLAQFHLKGI